MANLPVKIGGIEKGVQRPPVNGVARSRYPLRDMEVGDSFLVSGEVKLTRVSGRVYYAAKKLNIKVSIHVVEDGIRIWRVE